jgi:hypothetical protein
MLLPLALVLLVTGVLPATRAGVLWPRVVGVLVVGCAVLLLGVALGLRRSAAQDEAAAHEAAVDAAIMASSGPCGSDCSTGACAVTDCAVKALPRHQH